MTVESMIVEGIIAKAETKLAQLALAEAIPIVGQAICLALIAKDLYDAGVIYVEHKDEIDSFVAE